MVEAYCMTPHCPVTIQFGSFWEIFSAWFSSSPTITSALAVLMANTLVGLNSRKAAEKVVVVSQLISPTSFL